jgi:hypothetical protein
MKDVPEGAAQMRLLVFLSIIFFPVTAAWAAPRIAFDGVTHDFGNTIQGSTVEHVFTFRNTGDSPATIDHLATSCGCTAVNISSRTIPPGKEGQIKAAFNSTDFSGQVSKEIFVYFKEPQGLVQKLSIKGSVIEEIVITPRQLELGPLQPGRRKVFTLRVDNRSKKPVKIVAVKSPSAGLTFSWKPAAVNPGNSSTIRIAIDPPASGRFFSGYLTVTTNSGAVKEKTIPFFASIEK